MTVGREWRGWIEQRQRMCVPYRFDHVVGLDVGLRQVNDAQVLHQRGISFDLAPRETRLPAFREA